MNIYTTFFIVFNQKEHIKHTLFPCECSKKQVMKNWDEFFPNSTFQLNYTGTKHNTQIKVNDINVYISFCTFVKVENSENGGAVSFSSSGDSKMLIEESVFFDCHATLSGGAIFMSGSGYFAMNKCCSNFCFTLGTSSSGQFAYIQGESSNISEASIINSKPETNQPMDTICLFSMFEINTANISQNTCYQVPLGYMYTPSPNIALINLCSFENNTRDLEFIYFLSLKFQ